MTKKQNFRPRVIEPANANAPSGVGVAVELEFHESVPGLHGDSIVLHLKDDASMEQAERLRDLLAQFVVKVVLSNPK